MFDWGRRKTEPPRVALSSGLSTSPEMIGVLSEHQRVLLGAAGCLMGNIIGLGENMAAKLALGQMTADEARSVAQRMKEIGLTIEGICENNVSPVRARLMPEIPIAHPHEHP